jgi:coenzyme A diphosphatase NUDT7
LAQTALAVRPCVAFLHSDDEGKSHAASVEESMIPRLDAKEVAAVFSAPFHNFLKEQDEVREGEIVPGTRSDWYKGQWMDFNDTKWKMHSFFVPINNQKVSKPKVREGGQAAISEELDEGDDDETQRYKVWGMTARMLVDTARVAYGENPEFEVSRIYADL